MPTGYTAYIENGKITTGKEFLKLCTRAFGVAVDMRDEPLSVPTPRHVEPDPYYKERYDRALENFEKANKMTFDEARIEMENRYNNRMSCCNEYIESVTETNKKYEKVRKEIDEWVPPTQDHQNLKEFALEQIDKCIVNQDRIDSHIKELNEKFDDSDKAVEEYINDNIQYCKKSLDNSYKCLQQEIRRVEYRNLWMDELMESLEGMPDE